MTIARSNANAGWRAACAVAILALASVSAVASDGIEIFGTEVAGLSPLAVFGLLALATLVSEDLTAISAGVLASQGTISFPMAVAASAFGILVGDILLFAAGRYVGRPALGLPLVGYFVTENALDRSSRWLERRGMLAVFISRFVFGLRLPLYFAAGVLRTSFWRFTLFFALAVAVWTPLLVGASYMLGAQVVTNALFDQNLWLGLIVSGVLLFVGVRLIQTLATRKGRRMLLGSIKRRFIWEFWSVRVFYIPVVVKILTLGLRYRSLTIFTCANPSIPGGGFVGESKDSILRAVAGSPEASEALPRHRLFGAGDVDGALSFVGEGDIGFPVVVKPDIGERGSGVRIVRSRSELEVAIGTASCDQIVQKFAPGEEASVFYYRFPEDARGTIFAITEKRFPNVVGDGTSTLEDLILADDRAVCLAKSYLEHNRDRLDDVPARGESVPMIDIGTHSRGAIFLDGEHLRTPELEDRIDAICRGIDGFFFGRFDIRVRSFDDLKRGEDFKIVELNGVTSEATNIYDPRFTLIGAYRKLFRQWELAFAIGAANRRLGARPATVRELVRMFLDRPRRTAAPV